MELKANVVKIGEVKAIKGLLNKLDSIEQKGCEIFEKVKKQK